MLLRVTEYGHILHQPDVFLHRFNCRDRLRRMIIRIRIRISIRINWSSIIVTGISGTMITMPDTVYVSIFTDNDLTHITEDHFEIKLIARLLGQIYVI